MWRLASGAGRAVRYITFMGMLTHRFKCIVTALLLAVGFSLPVAAQQATLDELYQELREADETTYVRIQDRIIAEWEKSGSPAMDLLLRRGQEAMEAGTPEIAVEHFSAVVDHDPEFAAGYFGRASAYYAMNLIGPALEDLRTVLRLNPRHFDAMRGLATIMEEQERTKDALALYDMILAINPQSAEIQAAVERLKLQLEGQAL